jgi:hypothetical protein
MRTRRPSPAMIVALIALCVAMGGTGYAANSLVDSDGPTAQTADTEQASAAKKKKKARRGPPGPAGPQGPAGQNGAPGQPGEQGEQGQPGTPAVVQYAEFYALMPGSNDMPVAPGGTVDFVQAGPEVGDIQAVAADAYALPDIGTYRVSFNVPVTEPGQLGLSLNFAELPQTIVGRATETSQIIGESLITTTAVDSILSVVNPADNLTGLTITPSAGGTEPVVATLIIEQLS